MPESKSRASADAKKKNARKASAAKAQAENKKKQVALTDARGWVAPTFITLMLLGVLWIVVWYLTATTGIAVPVMSDIGNWNLLIGMGLMAASFGVATLWK